MNQKTVTISELRALVRNMLVEVLSEDEKDEKGVSKTEPAPPSHAMSVAKTEPAPSNSPPRERTTIGARDLNKVMQRMDMNTIPAKASNAEKAMGQEFKQKNLDKTGSEKIIPTTYSPNTQKASMIGKVLTSKGINVDEDALKAWLGALDPTDVLVKTTEQLASDYLGHQNSASAAH